MQSNRKQTQPMLRSLSTGQEGTQVMKILGFSAPVLLKCIALIAVLVVFACPLFGKRKDDVVIMKNGDTFTGEIKGLQHGELIFKSDYMKDSVHLDWAQVQTLQSKDIYIVGLSNGERLTGMITNQQLRVIALKMFGLSPRNQALRLNPWK